MFKTEMLESQKSHITSYFRKFRFGISTLSCATLLQTLQSDRLAICLRRLHSKMVEIFENIRSKIPRLQNLLLGRDQWSKVFLHNLATQQHQNLSGTPPSCSS